MIIWAVCLKEPITVTRVRVRYAASNKVTKKIIVMGGRRGSGQVINIRFYIARLMAVKYVIVIAGFSRYSHWLVRARTPSARFSRREQTNRADVPSDSCNLYSGQFFVHPRASRLI